MSIPGWLKRYMPLGSILQRFLWVRAGGGQCVHQYKDWESLLTLVVFYDLF
jgi:hypothetical protein